MSASENGTVVEGQVMPLAGSAPLPAVRVPPVAQAAVTVRPKRRIWLWLVAGIVVIAGGAAAYFQPWVTKATTVVLETVAAGPVTRVLAVNGRIAAVKSVTVRPLVGGTLSAVMVAEGDVVAKGDVLAEVDQSSQEAVVRQAKAGLDAALVAQATAEATLAREVALGANSPRTVLEDAARAAQTAAQEVARQTALMDQTQLQLRNYTIRAQMAGTVLALTPSPGQIVDTGTTLMTLADLSELVVETDVDEAYATQVAVDQPAALQLAGETVVRDGRVSFVSQQVNAASGGLAVKLGFDAAVKAPVGLTVTANIVVDARDDALTVPRAAVQTGADGSSVFVVVGDTAQSRPVTVIDWPAARLIVVEGLVAGDVVIADATGITEGLAVTGAEP